MAETALEGWEELSRFRPFDLDEPSSLLRDEGEGIALSRGDDELTLSREGARWRRNRLVVARAAPDRIREIRLYRPFARSRGALLRWAVELWPYEGAGRVIARTAAPKTAFDLAATVARLLDAPLAHGEGFNRRLSYAALQKSLWARADDEPLDTEPPAAPSGFELKELDGALEIAARAERQEGRALDWLGVSVGLLAVGGLVALLLVGGLTASLSPLARGAMLVVGLVWSTALWGIWRQRPRTRRIDAAVRVDTQGQVRWSEREGGDERVASYDAGQYLDFAPGDFPAFFGPEGYRVLGSELQPALRRAASEWLARAIVYCRALATGRRRLLLLGRTPVEGASSTELMTEPPRPFRTKE